MILVLFAELGPTASARALRSLSEEELARAASIRHEAERLRFVLGRHLLQTAITQATGVERFYTVEQREGGKPYLLDGPSCLDFSISHSADAVAVAVSTHGRVGLDIERVVELDPTTIESAFTAPELDSLASLPAAERPLACLHAWCAKEAMAKLHGSGILQGGPVRAAEIRSWTLDLGPENYQLCLAHEASPAEILLRKETA